MLPRRVHAGTAHKVDVVVGAGVAVGLAADLAIEIHRVHGDLRMTVSQVVIDLATVGSTKLRRLSLGARVLSGGVALTMASIVVMGMKHLRGTERTRCRLSSRVNPLYFEERIPVLL